MKTEKQPPEDGHSIMQRPYVDGKTVAHDWEATPTGWRCKNCQAVALDELLLPRRNCHGKST